SPDGTVALDGFEATQDGALLGYTISRSGSDRQEILVRDVATGQDLPDHLHWAKFTGLAWTPDNKGFYYTRYPQPGTVPKGDENYFGKVYYHRLGDPQDKDLMVFERPDARETHPAAEVTLDGRWLVLTTYMGASDKTEVHVLDRTAAGARPVLLPVTRGFTSAWLFVGQAGGRFFFITDSGAPLYKLVAVDYGRGNLEPVTVLAEEKDKLASAALVGGSLAVIRMHDAHDRLLIHDPDGKLVREVALPALGSLSALKGEADDDELYIGFTSFTFPNTPYRYDLKAGRLEVVEKTPARVDPTAYDVRQVWYASKDGTRVPMFLVHRKGLARNGRTPTLLYGYGGFNISMTPSYSSSLFVWLERGGMLALANLRGGGEYGEEWHQAGMREKKQTVFDDFIAAAEFLVKEGYTRPDRLAIQGGSNGGLLVGAAITQRPELFGAALCQVPVADMLRYHLFTVGRFWIPEYGSADDPAQFKFLYAYSPLHRVKDGVAYPATLVTTADTDDRVAPGMAKKFAARLQEATGGSDPILIRVETKAGHGAGKPVSKQIDEAADIYTFLMWQLGMFDEAPVARGTAR
ncbi:MAG TPA: prolyl oligopeptidase family serine peptidase, partial [Vicinamibacteria bacterium]|nr:prolyl oligopeptidase family serine peptidase [Vicinamibacteria bacterium]